MRSLPSAALLGLALLSSVPSIPAHALTLTEAQNRMPWVNVLGGYCGSDIRHLSAIVSAFQHVGEEQHS